LVRRLIQVNEREGGQVIIFVFYRSMSAQAKCQMERSMAKSQITSRERVELASADDVKSILGNLDADRLLDIMTLRPRIVDVEQASAWLAGDIDIFGAGPPLKDIPGDIVAILTADEDEEETARSG
jgi:hypothetical protein